MCYFSIFPWSACQPGTLFNLPCLVHGVFCLYYLNKVKCGACRLSAACRIQWSVKLQHQTAKIIAQKGANVPATFTEHFYNDWIKRGGKYRLMLYFVLSHYSSSNLGLGFFLGATGSERRKDVCKNAHNLCQLYNLAFPACDLGSFHTLQHWSALWEKKDYWPWTTHTTIWRTHMHRLTVSNLPVFVTPEKYIWNKNPRIPHKKKSKMFSVKHSPMRPHVTGPSWYVQWPYTGHLVYVLLGSNTHKLNFSFKK